MKYRSILLLLIILSLSMILPRASVAAPAPSMTILLPGEGSVLLSPITVSALVQPGADGLIRITLTNKFSQVISRQLLQVNDMKSREINLESQIQFEVPYPGLEGLLTIATQDEHHRPLAERSVQVTLDDGGEVQLLPNPAAKQWLDISSPEPNESLTGGTFYIEGTVTPVNEEPVLFELISDSGGQIGATQMAVGQPDLTFTFRIVISYGFISSPRDVRLIVRQTNEDKTVNVVLDSIPLILAP